MGILIEDLGSTSHDMKISFDLDGTFYAAPAVFAALGIALQKDGHRVGILTGHGFRSEVSDRAKLLEFGFSPNFYYGRNDGEVSLDVLQWKASKLEAQLIDVHVDDDADGIGKFTSRFMLKTKGGLPNLS